MNMKYQKIITRHRLMQGQYKQATLRKWNLKNQHYYVAFLKLEVR